MSTPRLRSAALIGSMAILPLGLTACGLSDGSGGSGGSDGSGGVAPSPSSVPVDDGARESRELVQRYLDAMRVKDVESGRGQLCAAMHEAFDRGATGPNGDFADHFTVTEATIVDIRPNAGGQEVSTAITVESGGRSLPAKIMFVVARGDGGWCIADEQVGGNTPATPGGAAPASPAG